MKVTWEVSDIRCGRRFGRPGIQERQMIGYTFIDNEKYLATVSLNDGLVNHYKDKAALAEYLNSNLYLPEELLPAV